MAGRWKRIAAVQIFHTLSDAGFLFPPHCWFQRSHHKQLKRSSWRSSPSHAGNIRVNHKTLFWIWFGVSLSVCGLMWASDKLLFLFGWTHRSVVMQPQRQHFIARGELEVPRQPRSDPVWFLGHFSDSLSRHYFIFVRPGSSLCWCCALLIDCRGNGSVRNSGGLFGLFCMCVCVCRGTHQSETCVYDLF